MPVTTRGQLKKRRGNKARENVLTDRDLTRLIMGSVENARTAARLRASMPQFSAQSLLNMRPIRNEVNKKPINQHLEREFHFKFVRNMRNYLNPNPTINTNAEKNILKKMNNLEHKLQALRNKHKRTQYQSLVNAVTYLAGLNATKLSSEQKKTLVNTALQHYQQNPNMNQRPIMFTNMSNALYRRVRTLFPTRNKWDIVRNDRGNTGYRVYPGYNYPSAVSYS